MLKPHLFSSLPFYNCIAMVVSEVMAGVWVETSYFLRINVRAVSARNLCNGSKVDI